MPRIFDFSAFYVCFFQQPSKYDFWGSLSRILTLLLRLCKRSSTRGIFVTLLLCVSSFFSNCSKRKAVSFPEANMPPTVPIKVPAKDMRATIIVLSITF